jgi:hypothetical protein
MNKALAPAILLLLTVSAYAQSLGNAGTIEGTVVDPSAASVPKATITLTNAVTGYKQSVESDSNGPGFQPFRAGRAHSQLRSGGRKGNPASRRRRIERYR